ERGARGFADDFHWAGIKAVRRVVAGERLERAVQVDRRIVSGKAQEGDHALRLAERVDTDEVRAVGKEGEGAQHFADLERTLAVAKYRQREGRFGDQEIARQALKGCAGWIRHGFVVTGYQQSQTPCVKQDLGGSQNVACRPKAHPDPLDRDSFAI